MIVSIRPAELEKKAFSSVDISGARFSSSGRWNVESHSKFVHNLEHASFRGVIERIAWVRRTARQTGMACSSKKRRE